MKQRSLSREDVPFRIHPKPQLYETARPIFDVLVKVAHGAFSFPFNPCPPSGFPGVASLLPRFLLQLLSPLNQQFQRLFVKRQHAPCCPFSERVSAQRLLEFLLLLVPVLPAVQVEELLQDSFSFCCGDGGLSLGAAREGVLGWLLALLSDLATGLLESIRTYFVTAD